MKPLKLGYFQGQTVNLPADLTSLKLTDPPTLRLSRKSWNYELLPLVPSFFSNSNHLRCVLRGEGAPAKILPLDRGNRGKKMHIFSAPGRKGEALTDSPTQRVEPDITNKKRHLRSTSFNMSHSTLAPPLSPSTRKPRVAPGTRLVP